MSIFKLILLLFVVVVMHSLSAEEIEKHIFSKVAVFENMFGVDDRDRSEFNTYACSDFLSGTLSEFIEIGAEFEEVVDKRFMGYKRAVQHLRRSRDYRMVREIRWKQLVVDAEIDSRVAVFGGALTGVDELGIAVEKCNYNGVFELMGSIEIIVKRFIHVFVAMQFTKVEDSTVRSYVIKDTHKLKSKDVYYIDHPRFGILLQAVYK